MAPSVDNPAVEGLPYFTPAHVHSPGAPTKIDANTPTLFTPLRIRSKTLRNRIIVAPMCQYSSAPSGPYTGALTDWHIATLGHYAIKGAAAVMIEATGVQPNGRISPNCPGLWNDSQIPGVRRVSEIIKSQGALSGIQLAHAGRKSSTVAPWVAERHGRHSVRAPAEVGGWPDDVVGPMGGESATWDGEGLSSIGGFYPPRALTIAEIEQLQKDFVSATKRSVEAGLDFIEIHAAHGYLLHQFLSPLTNQRTDQYGGSFENRTRLLVETLRAVREAMPESMPLFLRMSASEWMEETELGKKMGSWDLQSTIRFAKLLPGLGVDLLDVSSGGNHPQQQIQMFSSKDYQTKMAARIRKEMKQEGLSLLVGAVGLITEAEQARNIVNDVGSDATSHQQDKMNDSVQEEAKIAEQMITDQSGREPLADVVLIGRQFLREPEWVMKVAWELGVDVAWPNQFSRIKFRKL